jgi:RNA polymerase sigma factor (TIGR02999 family)
MATPGPAPFNDQFFATAYEELRRVARRLYAGNGSPTWNPTAIVHEVYLRLAESSGFQPCSPEHMKHTVIQAMRYILVDAARRRSAERRGGGKAAARMVPLDENASKIAIYDPNDILEVDFVLRELQRDNEFQARVFEYQFFGGLQVAEIAALTGTSEKKVQRSLRLARAFLAIALAGTKSK